MTQNITSTLQEQTLNSEYNRIVQQRAIQTVVTDAQRFIETVFESEQIVEIRVILKDGTIYTGFYTDRNLLYKSIAKLDSNPQVKGIYCVLNEINPNIVSEHQNQINRIAKGSATKDSDIIRRKLLYLDFDPIKAPGTPAESSSSEPEKKEAFERAEECELFLATAMFPEPIRGDSGNGAHLLYKIDLPNDEPSKELISELLLALKDLYLVDTTTKNASRICKLYGTTTRKGDDTQERPHRKSQLISIPEDVGVVMAITEETIVNATTMAKEKLEQMKGGAVKEISPEPGNATHTGGRHPIFVEIVTSNEAKGMKFADILDLCNKANATFTVPKTPEVVYEEIKALYKWAHSNSEKKRKNTDGSPKMRIYAGPSTGEFPKIQSSLTAIKKYYNDPNPRLFVRSGKLSRILADENGTPKIVTVDKDMLSVILTQCTNWFKYEEIEDPNDKKKRITVEKLTVTPPMVIARIIGLGEWEGIPPLVGIVESPYITDDGEIITTPGYNTKTRLFFSPSKDFKPFKILDKPTLEQVATAKKLLFDLFEEFSFEDQASRENHIACLITAGIRPIIHGAVPLAVYDKPIMGSGASLLGEIITQIVTGRAASMIHAPSKNTEEEWNKLIFSLLREGRSLNIFDNVEGDIYSSALAMLLTSTMYRSRILATNETAEYPNNALWMANGNNILITHDLPRRCFWIRLSTDVARPYERTNWKIPNIREYSLEHRSDYLAAILTIARSWHVAGRTLPNKDSPVMGGFEKWINIVGGIMAHMGCTEFLKNTSTNIDSSEELMNDAEIFLESLFLAFPKDIKNPKITTGFFVREIKVMEPRSASQGDINATYVQQVGEILVDKLPVELQSIHSKDQKRLSQATGYYLRKYIGRMFGNGLKLEKLGVERTAMKYRIVGPLKEQPK